MQNKEKYEILGKIKFKTSSTLDEIIKDFAETYIDGIKWHNPLEGKPASGVVYLSSFEPTIAPAFERYFSNLKS